MLVIDKTSKKIIGACSAQVQDNPYVVHSTDHPPHDVEFPLINIVWGQEPDSMQTVPALVADSLQQAQTYLPNFIEYVQLG